HSTPEYVIWRYFYFHVRGLNVYFGVVKAINLLQYILRMFCKVDKEPTILPTQIVIEPKIW
ncbi:MAG: hypothetical protein ABH886_09845, partial [Candidatus Desantisbacteria bacterium]